MNKQTFEIVDGVYVGPEVWKGELDLREYKDTLTSLGDLKKAEGSLDLNGCTNLVSLGSLTEAGNWLDLEVCTKLVSLGSLREVGGSLRLFGCTSLVSLGSLEEVKGCLRLRGCTSLSSLGSLKKVGGVLYLRGRRSSEEFYKSSPLQEVQEKIYSYSHLPAHEALNALHTEEVQEVPLYQNILLSKLQGC